MNLGPGEILVICVIALLVFGPQRLPEIARQVGAAMRELRRWQDSVRTELREVLDEQPAPAATTRAPGATPDAALPEEPDHTDVPQFAPDATGPAATPNGDDGSRQDAVPPRGDEDAGFAGPESGSFR
jgi:Tat protein translocase TatB subunit